MRRASAGRAGHPEEGCPAGRTLLLPGDTHSPTHTHTLTRPPPPLLSAPPQPPCSICSACRLYHLPVSLSPSLAPSLSDGPAPALANGAATLPFTAFRRLSPRFCCFDLRQLSTKYATDAPTGPTKAVWNTIDSKISPLLPVSYAQPHSTAEAGRTGKAGAGGQQIQQGRGRGRVEHPVFATSFVGPPKGLCHQQFLVPWLSLRFPGCSHCSLFPSRPPFSIFSLPFGIFSLAAGR